MQYSDIEKYNYTLPEELIRKVGVEPRDSARLFVYDTKTDEVYLDTFRNLAKYLPKESLIVLNNTRVLPARLWLTKETGGKIEVFVLANEMEAETRIPILVDRKVSVGQKLLFPNGDYFEVVDQRENVFSVKVVSEMSLETLLETFGETPLPHYLEGAHVEESALRKRYQTIFAESGASVAAPTASLHFTENVFKSLEEKGVKKVELTLNVGLGTFAPLKEESFATKKLHPEYVVISPATAQEINETKEKGKKVIAVGTTVTRTLEAFGKTGKVKAATDKTDIFIYPPYNFAVVDCLITNFHLPKTSLMLLVGAFLESKGAKRNVVSLYGKAIEEKFSFYSFGDSMLIL